jgi:hypothetical protein
VKFWAEHYPAHQGPERPVPELWAFKLKRYERQEAVQVISVLGWCEDQFGLESESTWYYRWRAQGGIMFFFLREEYATAFKLRWYNSPS